MKATRCTARLSVAGLSLALAALLAGLVAPAAAQDEIPLPLKLPRAAFAGTPKEIPEGVEDVEPMDPERKNPMVPAGIKQLALNKPVTSANPPYNGELKIITDGEKEAYEDTLVELRPRTQWVQIDLGAEHKLYQIAIWHFHLEPIIVHDVIVQISNDPEFKTGVTTLFNNDRDNSSGLGVGTDREYWESNMGKLVAAKATKARYVRTYARGSTYTDPLNRYTEIEVWGL